MKNKRSHLSRFYPSVFLALLLCLPLYAEQSDTQTLQSPEALAVSAATSSVIPSSDPDQTTSNEQESTASEEMPRDGMSKLLASLDPGLGLMTLSAQQKDSSFEYCNPGAACSDDNDCGGSAWGMCINRPFTQPPQCTTQNCTCFCCFEINCTQ